MEIKEIKTDNGKMSQFILENETGKVGEMLFSVSENILTVYHTEVDETLKGQGLAGKLLEHLVTYARAHKLLVSAKCPYVSVQFRRYHEKYVDIINPDFAI